MALNVPVYATREVVRHCSTVCKRTVPHSQLVFSVTGACHRRCGTQCAWGLARGGKTGTMPQGDVRGTRANLRQHMLAKLQTFSLLGIDAVRVEVEVSD